MLKQLHILRILLQWVWNIEVSFGIALGYLRNITYLFSVFSSFTTFIYLMDHVKTFKLILQDVDAEGSIFHNATLRE
jgi:hypothetical protein